LRLEAAFTLRVSRSSSLLLRVSLCLDRSAQTASPQYNAAPIKRLTKLGSAHLQFDSSVKDPRSVSQLEYVDLTLTDIIRIQRCSARKRKFEFIPSRDISEHINPLLPVA
jgi:hypothetical protein